MITIKSDGTARGTDVFHDKRLMSGITSIKIHKISDPTGLVHATLTFENVELNMKIDKPDLQFNEVELRETES